MRQVSAFTGRVLLVTTPSGIKGCAGVHTPNAMPSEAERRDAEPASAAFWYHTNPQGSVLHPDASGAFHHFGKLRQARQSRPDH